MTLVRSVPTPPLPSSVHIGANCLTISLATPLDSLCHTHIEGAVNYGVLEEEEAAKLFKQVTRRKKAGKSSGGTPTPTKKKSSSSSKKKRIIDEVGYDAGLQSGGAEAVGSSVL
eukprot:CAMPEP_0178710024 /NCGR_PEP_ID=MMETSP0699-20121125/17555_1 /TAXON_ID=265572 /ORGANISM="Extubocellulus spinifer, Strain CCMP396" /LENGTH=113 /DNA_ID=CAMNT_0020358535 /DNA_START=164 /DNA_END=504 /DNA_ORIENTATION=-